MKMSEWRDIKEVVIGMESDAETWKGAEIGETERNYIRVDASFTGGRNG